MPNYPTNLSQMTSKERYTYIRYITCNFTGKESPGKLHRANFDLISAKKLPQEKKKIVRWMNLGLKQDD